MKKFWISNEEGVRDFLKGFVLMAYADSYLRLDARTRLKSKRLGLGLTLPIDRESANGDFRGKSSLVYGNRDIDKLEELLDRGIIVAKDARVSYPPVINTYVRVVDEPGVCDEAAMYAIRKKYSLIAMIGAVLADTIDTFKDKVYDFFYGNLPLEIANYVEKRWKEKYHLELASEQEKLDIIRLSSKTNSPPLSFSTSHTKLARFGRYARGASGSVMRGIARDTEAYGGLMINPVASLGYLREVVDRRLKEAEGIR